MKFSHSCNLDCQPLTAKQVICRFHEVTAAPGGDFGENGDSVQQRCTIDLFIIKLGNSNFAISSTSPTLATPLITLSKLN